MTFTQQQLDIIENDKQIIIKRFSPKNHELIRFLRGPYFHSVYAACRCGEYCSHRPSNDVFFNRISNTYDKCEEDLEKHISKHERLVSCEKIDAVRSEAFLRILCRTFAEENCYVCSIKLKDTVIHEIITGQSINGSGFDEHRIVDIFAAYATALGTFFDPPPKYTEEEKIWDADFKWIDPKKIPDALKLRSYIWYRRKEINYLEGVVRGHTNAISKEQNNISEAERKIKKLKMTPQNMNE